MTYSVKLQHIEHINHNVVRLITDKPRGYNFMPGQATNVAIDKGTLASQKRPFTFTSLPEDETLEFIIKIYPPHNGVTEQIEKLNVGDALIIEEAWGAISYKGAGAFIAGGAGVTPFIAIFKDLQRKGILKDCQLYFSVNTSKDIILKDNLEAWLGERLHITLSKETTTQYPTGYIDTAFLKAQDLEVTNPVYLCGPPEMMAAVKTDLFAMGVPKSQLITEA